MKNETYYIRIRIPSKESYRPEIDSSNWWIYLLGSVIVIFIGPFFNKYKHAYFEYEMMRIWITSALIVIVLNAIFLWFLQIRPYLEKGKGYFFLGKFEIVEKNTKLGKGYLTLNPGNRHLVKVSGAFFKSVQEGDKIIVERNCLGDIRNIKKVSGIRERLKMNANKLERSKSSPVFHK